MSDETDIPLDSTDLLDQALIIRDLYEDYVPLARDGNVEPHVTMLQRLDTAIKKERGRRAAAAERERTARTLVGAIEQEVFDERISRNRDLYDLMIVKMKARIAAMRKAWGWKE